MIEKNELAFYVKCKDGKRDIYVNRMGGGDQTEGLHLQWLASIGYITSRTPDPIEILKFNLRHICEESWQDEEFVNKHWNSVKSQLEEVFSITGDTDMDTVSGV